jgi:iron(III) transport system ATP-binding protein
VKNLSGSDKVQSDAIACDLPRIRLRCLKKRFRVGRAEVAALNGVSLEVASGEKLVLLGPSGCGKTTLLRCIAGLEMPDEGEIEIDGQIVFSSTRRILVPPEKRGVSMVFQSYALWPHMTVFDNVAYPLANMRVAMPEIRLRVAEALRMVHCEGLEQRYPGQLSGGQQQRIALARALVGRESTILLDEPLSNIDAKVREALRLELVTLQKQLGFTAIYVTHDQAEASAFAHRIAVMESGGVTQIGLPRRIYEAPVSRFVATFTGATNTIAGTVVDADQNGEGVTVMTPVGRLRGIADADSTKGTSIEALCRPEHLYFATDKQTNCFPITIESVMFHGLFTEYAVVAAGNMRLVMRTVASTGPSEGETTFAAIDPDQLRIFRSVAAAPSLTNSE